MVVTTSKIFSFEDLVVNSVLSPPVLKAIDDLEERSFVSGLNLSTFFTLKNGIITLEPVLFLL